jgi:carbon-monoxide dehydrogenase large subunit
MTVTLEPARVFGSGIRRREDPRLLTGTARYTDDIVLPGLAHAAILRSPHAHALIMRIDTERAKAAPGVLAVFTAADTQGVLKPIPCCWLLPGSNLKTTPYHPLAKEAVHYVGDPVAVVLAEDRYRAEDAVERIEVEWDVLPAVVDARAASDPGASLLFEPVGTNVAASFQIAYGDVERALREADHGARE